MQFGKERAGQVRRDRVLQVQSVDFGAKRTG